VLVPHQNSVTSVTASGYCRRLDVGARVPAKGHDAASRSGEVLTGEYETDGFAGVGRISLELPAIARDGGREVPIGDRRQVRRDTDTGAGDRGSDQLDAHRHFSSGADASVRGQ
jgi:hypothetical protein